MITEEAINHFINSLVEQNGTPLSKKKVRKIKKALRILSTPIRIPYNPHEPHIIVKVDNIRIN